MTTLVYREGTYAVGFHSGFRNALRDVTRKNPPKCKHALDYVNALYDTGIKYDWDFKAKNARLKIIPTDDCRISPTEEHSSCAEHHAVNGLKALPTLMATFVAEGAEMEPETAHWKIFPAARCDKCRAHKDKMGMNPTDWLSRMPIKTSVDDLEELYHYYFEGAAKSGKNLGDFVAFYVRAFKEQHEIELQEMDRLVKSYEPNPIPFCSDIQGRKKNTQDQRTILRCQTL